jgi:integrase
LNPGSPAPQASVLIQSRASGTRTQGNLPKIQAEPDSLTRLRAHTQGILHEDRIINTLLQMKNSGLSEATLATASQKLNQLGKHADLQNPQEILTYIANSTVSNATKQKLANDYNYYCITNQINWKKPTYRWERKIPLIPTTENIYKIISASCKKYATIFTILEETGLEGKELETTTRRDIDAEQGIINVQGCKGHNSRSLKLKQQTAEMLRAYLHKYAGEHPFPKSIRMGEV